MPGYWDMLQRSPSLIGMAQAAGITKAQRDAKEAERKRLEAEMGAAKFDREMRVREAEDRRAQWDHNVAEAQRQRDEQARAGQLKAQAEQKRFFANLIQAQPDKADQIAQVARQRGINIGTVVDPQTMRQARTTGIEIEDAVSPEQAAMDLGARSASVLGAPEAPKQAPMPYDQIGEKVANKYGYRQGTPDYHRAYAHEEAIARRAEEAARRADNDAKQGDATFRLRDKFLNQQTVKDTQQMATAFRKVNSASDSAAGDMSLVYGYMKILDPATGVKEGETTNAEEAGGVVSKYVNTYNRLVKGERLTPEIRAQFKSEAERLYGAQLEQYDKIAKEFRRLAGPAADDVVLDLFDRPVRPGSKRPPVIRDIGSADARALQLEQQGMPPDQVIEVLRSEGLVQ